MKPTNLQVFSNNGTDDVVVVWDAIDDVAGYTVVVSLFLVFLNIFIQKIHTCM